MTIKPVKRKNFKELKKKKRENYLKNKLKKSFDYQAEIDSGEFFAKLQSITKQHKKSALSREEIIAKKIEEYREKKKKYYTQNKEAIKEYNKKYKEALKKENEDDGE